MRTRNSYFPNNSSATIPRCRNKRRTPNIVEPELRTIVEMAENRTMEELLQAPTKGMNTTSRENTSKSDDRIDKLADHISTLVDIFAKKVVTLAPVNAVEESCVTCGGAHAYYNCPNTDSNQQSVCANQSSTSGTLPSNTLPNPKGEMKEITTRSGVAYEDKLFELAKIHLNENCSVMQLKNIPKKLEDPGKFLIPCDFPGMDVCHALADLGASINLMPLSIWKKLSPELTSTRMTLELADRSITRPKGVTKDVFVKVGKEEYDQEILGFSNYSSGGNPTLISEPILSDSSISLTSFEGSDFILKEIDAYLKDESILLEINHADCDPERDICLIEKLLNNDPFQLPPMDLKQGVVVKVKSSIEEPLELELKDLSSHLEYAYIE
nr:reverse transcriptase domain-containing protein [Tanacetum cinerariifolium]